LFAASLEARRAFDRSAGRAFAGASIPSRSDIQRLRDQVREIEEELTDLRSRLAHLADKVETSRAPRETR
jgi:transposase-like protein